MEASFAMYSNKQLKAFKGPVSKEQLKGLLKIKIEGMIEVVLAMIRA